MNNEINKYLSDILSSIEANDIHLGGKKDIPVLKAEVEALLKK